MASSSSELIKTWDAARALYVLGLLQPDEISHAADLALASGLSSPSLLELAGLTRAESADASRLFAEAMAELSSQSLAPRDAAIQLATGIARDIVSQVIDPYQGAKLIWRLRNAVTEPGFHDLDPFVYATTEYEDRPEERDHFSSEIVKEAVRWTNRHDRVATHPETE